MAVLVLVLLVLALALFLAATFLAHRARTTWATLVAAGLALWMLVQLLGALPGGVG
jgi:cell division protein FtsW (lipid II flippase)